jgi:aspartate/methionine/tyrosine aminotransferase
MRFPEFVYMSWSKAHPRAKVNLARSGVAPCPVELLRPTREDFVTTNLGLHGWVPLREAIAQRYGVSPESVVTASGGCSLANWLALAALLEGASPRDEVIVEKPTYGQLLAVPKGYGCRVVRLKRRLEDGYAIDLDAFRRLVTKRTRAAVVTNLQNPTGVRIPLATLREMAAILADVGAHLLVDEVYLETLFDGETESSVKAGPNVLATSSLTKAYGLDGLRCGWILAPEALARRAYLINDHLGVNGVATGERLSLAAFRNLAEIRRRCHLVRDANAALVREFLAKESRLATARPESNVFFPRLPRGLDGDAFSEHLLAKHRTLVVPGRFFESPRHVRLAFGGDTATLRRGLDAVSRALDELAGGRDPS